MVMRADSGFYNHNVTAACDKAGVSYSITAKLFKGLHDLIATIAEEAWVPIPYWIGKEPMSPKSPTVPSRKSTTRSASSCGG